MKIREILGNFGFVLNAPSDLYDMDFKDEFESCKLSIRRDENGKPYDAYTLESEHSLLEIRFPTSKISVIYITETENGKFGYLYNNMGIQIGHLDFEEDM